MSVFCNKCDNVCSPGATTAWSSVLLHARSAPAGVDYQIDVDPESTFTTDRDRLNVVLNNLVSNAIKYHDPAREHRFVKVKAWVAANWCTIQIIDNGVGIAAEYHEKMYDMFFRASERSDGSGLGLYIVKETLQRLNGEIRCRSQEGLGSTFEIRIPSL